MKNMKHLMRYEGYSSKERLDDILDKISKYGISSLSDLEKQFLDSHKSGSEESIHNKLIRDEHERVFEDDKYFKFELSDIEEFDGEIHYTGTLYVPDLEFPNGSRVEGRLEGKIVVYESGQISPDFFSVEIDPESGDHYDVFEFCNGLEYELDSFLDYVVAELQGKN